MTRYGATTASSHPSGHPNRPSPPSPPDPFNRLEWLRELGLTHIANPRRKNLKHCLALLLVMPEEGFRVMLTRIIEEKSNRPNKRKLAVLRERMYSR